MVEPLGATPSPPDIRPRLEEGTVRRTGMHSVQSVDDVHTLLEWLQGFDGFGQFRLG